MFGNLPSLGPHEEKHIILVQNPYQFHPRAHGVFQNGGPHGHLKMNK